MKTLIRAGAGAGKTWTLTRQVVAQAEAYFEEHGSWPRTVVTTFTRKATQELRERILEYCLLEKPNAVAFAQSEAHLFITTIHGLLDRYLRGQGFRLGLPSQFLIVDSAKGALLRKQILKTLFKENSDFCELLLTFDFRRLTQVMANMESLGFEPKSSFCDAKTFEGLARQTWSGLSKDLGIVARRVIDAETSPDWLAYGEGLMAIATMDRPEWADLRNNWNLGISALKRPRKSKKNPPLPEDLDLELKALMVRLKALAEGDEYSETTWERSEGFHKLLQKVYLAYSKNLAREKIQSGELEVSDLEPLSKLLMDRKPESVEPFAAEWDSWFIDEFQDTSPLQIELLEPFLKSSRAFFVGDPQQSIYLFRGARSEVFKEIEDAVTASADGDVRFLQKNYRSQESYLHFINDFFQKLSPKFSAMEAHHPTEDRNVACILQAESTDHDRDQEVTGLLIEIDALLKSGVPPKEIAILGRTNKDMERIARALSEGAYPYLSHSSAGFFARQEIQDALALLSVLVNPRDDYRLIQFLRSPWFPMEMQQIVNLVDGKKENYWPGFREFFRVEKYEAGLKLLELVELAQKTSVTWAFRRGLVALGMIDAAFAMDSSGRMEANLWKLVNIMEKNSREPGSVLLEILETQSLGFDLHSDSTEDAASAIVPDKINLMTVHASKGLQFPYVFVPFLDRKPMKKYFQDFAFDEESSQWAFRLPIGEDESFIGNPLEKKVVAETLDREEEESLRVLYVALTRAQTKVFLSWSGEPKAGSWGLSLQQYSDAFSGSPAFDIETKKLEEQSRPRFTSSNQTPAVRPPFKSSEDLSGPSHENSSPEVDDPESQQNVEAFLKSQNKRVFGIWVHELMESLSQIDEQGLELLISGASPSEAEAIRSAFLYVQSLDVPDIVRLSREGYKEWGFQYLQGEEAREGRVDLWGIQDETLWVVDFKTGSTHFKDKAFEQLEHYARILTDEKLGLKFNNVKLMALFPVEETQFTKDFSPSGV